jgi:hypothetical protein
LEIPCSHRFNLFSHTPCHCGQNLCLLSMSGICKVMFQSGSYFFTLFLSYYSILLSVSHLRKTWVNTLSSPI